MPTFDYSAISRSGQKVSGKLTATNQEAVVAELRKQGLYVINIKGEKTSILQKEFIIGKILKLDELVVFTRQLATLIKSGVTILDAIYVLKEQAENKQFKKVLADIENKIRNGETFSSTLADHPKAFPTMFVNMVKAGEASGNLDGTLNSVAVFFEKEHATRKKVKSALTYPIVVSIFAILVTIFLLIKVVPTFVQTFIDLGAELPLPTRIVLGLSDFIVANWYILLATFLLIVFAIIYAGKTATGRYYLDYFKLKLPIFGKLIQKSAIARLARTFSSLLTSAVPILQSMTMTAQIVGNEAIAKPLREARDSLRQGNSIHEPLEKHKVFPPLLTHMMAIGEETGSIEEMLTKVAEFYESDVETMTDQLKAMIEPLMIVFLTLIVGTIILAVLMPMFSIYGMIGQ